MTETIDFFSSHRDPYYIVASDYRQNSAGIRALHYLCHALNELGCEAYLSPASCSGAALNVRFLTRERMIAHYRAGRMPIAVYPEVVSGNPLAAPVVARWLLNRPGHLGGDTHHAEGDLVFHYQDWCRPEGLASHRLSLTPTDTRIFNNDDNPFDGRRRGHCYYANKYLGHGGAVPREIAAGGISVGQENRLSHEELADVFRRAEVLYCFEPSGIAQEALLCGCPVLLVPSDYWNPDERPELIGHGVGVYGRAGALEKARADLRQRPARLFVETDYRVCRETIDDFVRLTQQAAQQRRAFATGSPWDAAARDRESGLPAFLAALPPRFLYDNTAASDDTTPAGGDDFALPATLAGLAPPAGRPFEILVVEEQPLDSALEASLASLAAQPAALFRHLVVAPREKPPAMPADLLWLTTDDPWRSVNELLAGGDGEAWVGVLRAGNRLAAHALAALALTLARQPAWSALVTDDSLADPRSGLRLLRPLPPPGRELLRGGRYAPGWLLAQRRLWRAAGGWRYVPHRVDELDATLRLAEAAASDGFGHVPDSLHIRHPRHDPLPELADTGELRRLVVGDHLRRSGEAAEALPGLFPGCVRVRQQAAARPAVSLIVTTRDNAEGLGALLRSLQATPPGAGLELIVVDNGSVEPAARALLDRLRSEDDGSLRVVAHDGPGNLAAMNNAGAAEASGELLVFLHDDVEALHGDWLDELAAQCLRPGVAAAGPRLLARDGTIEQAGLVAMRCGLAPPLFRGERSDVADESGLLGAVREVSALGGACLMVRRALHAAVGGMDATHFPLRGADVDFCLRLRAAGHRIVWTPYATLLHDSDDSSRCGARDNNALLARWGRHLFDDPGFSPALALDGTHWRAEREPQFAHDPFAALPVPQIFCVASPRAAYPDSRCAAAARAAASAGLARARFWPTLPVPLLLARQGVGTLIGQACLDARAQRALAECRALAGCRVVIDIDDLLAAMAPGDFAGALAALAGLATVADGFTTSSLRFAAEAAGAFAGKLAYLPAALPALPLPAAAPPARPSGDRPRVGWVGEAADLERIAGAVGELQDEVDWIAVGSPPDLLKPCLRERYQPEDGAARVRLLAGLGLDFAVLPLAADGASDWLLPAQLLEFAALGIPLLASDIAGIPDAVPVTRLPATNRAWSAAIRDWAAAPQQRAAAAAALAAYVAREHCLATLLPRWRAIWQGAA